MQDRTDLSQKQYKGSLYFPQSAIIATTTTTGSGGLINLLYQRAPDTFKNLSAGGIS